MYWLALAGTIALILLGARHSGRQAERIEQLRRQAQNAEAVNDIKEKQLEAAADRPRTRDDLRKRMQDGSF